MTVYPAFLLCLLVGLLLGYLAYRIDEYLNPTEKLIENLEKVRKQFFIDKTFFNHYDQKTPQ